MAAPASVHHPNRKPQASLSAQLHPTTLTTALLADEQKTTHHCPRAKRSKPANVRPAIVIGSRIAKNGSPRHQQTRTAKAPSSSSARPAALLIRISVNNRLGTRREIPCASSDTVGEFKQVAALYMGTKPEAMLLRRQGERALKDGLTLEDYGIGTGCSLDLEVDTC